MDIDHERPHGNNGTIAFLRFLVNIMAIIINFTKFYIILILVTYTY